MQRRHFIATAAGLSLGSSTSWVFGKTAYDDGASDTEIKIGHSNAFSGPVSAFGAIGLAMQAYFRFLNDRGGINGRKLTFLMEDDAYTPPKTLEVTRKLVERERVLFMAAGMGTATQSAVQPYLHSKKVPQLFVLGGASKWGNPKKYPWTMGWSPTYASEAVVYVKAALAQIPDARIAVVYADDDFGKDYLAGVKAGLGSQANRLVAQAPVQVSDPTIDSPVAQLKASGANVLVNAAPGKTASQVIRACGKLGWKPLHFLNNNSAGIKTFLEPAGLENCAGLVTALYRKDPNDPRWTSDVAMAAWRDWMAKYNPSASVQNELYIHGYCVAQTVCQVLLQCGNDLTRANVMRQAASLRNFQLPLNLPGVTVNTSATDFFPMEAMQLARFDTNRWELFSSVIDVSYLRA